jgi:chromosomal replication initiator protein
VVDYLTEISLPGRTIASTRVATSARAPEVEFPSFVAGPENRLVASAVNRLLNTATIAAAADKFTPKVLALFGPSGVGKTHLARGLVRHWQEQLGDEISLYVTAADFRRYFLQAIDTNTVEEFRRQFRSHRLLAIDDLHQLPADAYLSQELRSTLDACDELDATVVVTSNRPADTLSNLPPDVRSRLASGLTLQLAAPGFAARMSIIRHASTALGRTLSGDAEQQLANGLRGTAPEVFGALFEFWAAAPTDGTCDATRTQRLLAARAARRPTLREIIAVVAKYTNVPQKQLKSGSRKQSIVLARAIVVYLARELSAISYDQIGRALGGRDHSTIMHNFRKIDRERLRNLATQQSLEDLARILLSR